MKTEISYVEFIFTCPKCGEEMRIYSDLLDQVSVEVDCYNNDCQEAFNATLPEQIDVKELLEKHNSERM